MARRKFTEDERAQKRSEILDGAMAVFEQDGGLEALSFRKLATQMGLSYSAPYRYFASKEELVTALRARAYRWIESEMREAIQAIESPTEQLEALSLAYIRSGVARPHRYALMYFNLDGNDVAKRSVEFRKAKFDALDICTRVIAAGQACGDLPKGVDPLTASHLFWIGAHGLVSLEVAGQFEMGRDLAALIPTLTQTLRRGMEEKSMSRRKSEREKRKEKQYG